MYYFIFILGLVFIFISQKSKIILPIFSIILTLIAIFRYGVGNDYFGYKYLYNTYSSNPLVEFNMETSREEMLFRIIASVFKSINLSYEYFIAIFAIITIFIVYKICKIYSVNPMLSIFIFYSCFYLVWVLSGIRQGFTITAGMWLVLYCYRNNKNLLLIFGVIFLSYFHKSAIIIIIIYYLAKLKLNKQILIYLIAISFVVSLLPFNFINLLSLIPSIGNRVIVYQESLKLINFDFQSFVRLLFCVITLVFYNSLQDLGKEYKYIVKYYLIGIIFYFIFKDVELLAARLSIYSRIFEILLIPGIVLSLKKYTNKTTWGLLILLFLSVYFIKDLMNISNLIIDPSRNILNVPYTNVFNYEKYEFQNYEFYKNTDL